MKPSRLEPGSMPSATDEVFLADGSRLRRTHQIPLRQNGVASPDFTHLRARAGRVGIRGRFWLSSTGTNIFSFSTKGKYFASPLTTEEVETSETFQRSFWVPPQGGSAHRLVNRFRQTTLPYSCSARLVSFLLQATVSDGGN